MGRLCYRDVLKARFIGEMIAMDGGGVGPSDPSMWKVCPPPNPRVCHAPQICVFELEKNPYAITKHTFLHSGEHFFEFKATNEFAGVEASPVRGPHWLGEVH